MLSLCGNREVVQHFKINLILKYPPYGPNKIASQRGQGLPRAVRSVSNTDLYSPHLLVSDGFGHLVVAK